MYASSSEEALIVESKTWCRELRARRWRNVEYAGVAVGRRSKGGSVVVDKVYERPYRTVENGVSWYCLRRPTWAPGESDTAGDGGRRGATSLQSRGPG